MSIDILSGTSLRTNAGVRLIKRLERSDPFLMRIVQGAALMGIILGVLIYSWQAVRGETLDTRRALAEAATVGQVAAEAELTRIDAVAVEVSPLISAAMAGAASPEEARALKAGIGRILARTPVTAIVAFDARGGIAAVFGELPADAAGVGPKSTSHRAGNELLGIELVPLSERRAAYYRDLPAVGGKVIPAALVLHTGAFQSALHVGAAGGPGWRAAILNRDGETVLSAAAGQRTFSVADAYLAAEALGWRPLHADEAAASDRTGGVAGETFIETRAVAEEMLQIVYVGEVAPAFSILASRRFEFMALFGAALLAVALAVSVIQNEWQRHDRHVRDADLAAARADVTCDLLAAGVIDWSVADGAVEYSECWADMFAQGQEPTSESIFDWIARIHTDDRAAARENYQTMLDNRMSELVHRIRIRMSSGLWVQVVERGRAIADIHGRIKRIVLVQTTEPVDGRTLRGAFGSMTVPAAEAV